MVSATFELGLLALQWTNTFSFDGESYTRTDWPRNSSRPGWVVVAGRSSIDLRRPDRCGRHIWFPVRRSRERVRNSENAG